jgi:hypothetical protein
LTDGQGRFIAVYLPKAQTITGVKWWQSVQGNYTADNENRIGLYTYSGGNMTLVASTLNDANLWSTAVNNSMGSKAFSTTYSASAGLYYIGFVWNASATTTAPSIGSGTAIVINIADFTNSAKIGSTFNMTALPSSLAQSSTSAQVGNLGIWLY